MKVPFFSFDQTNEQIRSEILASFEVFLDQKHYILGKQLEQFEKAFAQHTQSNYAIGVNSGMSALYLSLMALGVGKGDEVIVPAFTFVATALAVQQTGATPIFTDVLPSGNIDANKLEEHLSPKTKAIIGVHLYGQPCELDKLSSFADKHNIHLIEDNAQAQGATFQGKPTGSFGTINATSFYPTKNLGALGDGGAITTNNEVVYKKCLQLRNYGSSQKYEHQTFGINARLDEVQAGFLSVKLHYLAQWNKERQQIAEWYFEGLKDIKGIKIPVLTKNTEHVFHIFTVHTKDRNQLQTFLKEKGIGTLIHYPIPLHLQEVFSYLNYKKGDFPIAEEIAETTLSLPLFIGITKEQVRYVCQQIKSFHSTL